MYNNRMKLVESYETAKLEFENVNKIKELLNHNLTKGVIVNHKTFGPGEIVEINEEYITLVFPNHGEKKFSLSQSFVSGFLSCNIPCIEQCLTKNNFTSRTIDEIKRNYISSIKALEDIKKNPSITVSHQVTKKIQSIQRKAKEPIYIAEAALTNEQKNALEELESGKNIFLTGGAGTGKSFVLNEFIYRKKEKNIIVCAPTGIAAINVGGVTLHRMFNVPLSVIRPGEFNDNPNNSIAKADIIIIDEISMCRLDVFEYVIRTIRYSEKTKKQIIVVGDFFQLPPVVTPNDKEVLSKYWDMDYFGSGFPFNSDIWETLNFKNIVLKEIIRQKDNIEFMQNLNKIRKGDTEGIYWFNDNTNKTPIENSIYLCAKNKEVDNINLKESKKISGEPKVYEAQILGQVQDSDMMTEKTLELKIGMLVMTLVNDTEEGYQNGSIGIIKSLHDDSVILKLNSGKLVTVKPYEWEIFGYELEEDKIEKIVVGTFRQLPLKSAYAITIHKAQGQTFSGANISPDCFLCGQLYVALSRVQNITEMSLTHNISKGALKTAPEVKSFYENLGQSE